MIESFSLEQYVRDRMEGLDMEDEWSKGASWAYLVVLQFLEIVHEKEEEDA